MRQIKFRAWNTKTNTMIDCYKVTSLALHPELVGKQDGVFIPFHDDYILEQFTGLCDKDGVEIYEGDIVAFQHYDDMLYNEETDELSFSESAQKARVVWPGVVRGDFGDYGNEWLISWAIDMDYKFKVIGNIHTGETK